ncbi:site-specific integrase [Traorella massiliensis]|uniref:site-specific integrase n=1 Tax=Traorella massiliensis TaxID=1903263 RepID=UPI00248E1D8B|nr:site-specific integrase [Traorella massiliensis]
MSVHKDERANGKWVVVYKNRKKRGFTTKREAQMYESKLKLSEDENTCNMYIYDVADMYLDDLYKRVTYGSYIKRFQVYRDYIKPNIKNKRISLITTLDCKKFNDYVGSLKFSTVHKNCILSTYKLIFTFAKKYLNLKNNPSDILENFKSTPEEKMKKKDAENNIWSVDEFNQFIKFVKIKKYKVLFYVLFYTGIRQGEAQALQWKDYYDGVLDIYKNYTKKTDKGIYEIKDTKSVNSVRKITLNQGLINILDDYKKDLSSIKGFNDEWFIFGNIEPLARTNINRVKDRACKESGVKRITLHGFRHSHVSNLISNDVNIVAVSRRLGHSNIDITLKTYTHLMKKNEDELVKSLDLSFQNLSNDKSE